MGFDLSNKNREYRFNIDLWPKVLKLALSFDWIPKGTILKVEGWKGSYLENSGQKVTPMDAVNIASALERALGSIPVLGSTVEAVIYPKEILPERGIKEMVIEGLSGIRGGLYIPEREERRKLLYEFGNDESREYLGEFIDFCWEGEGFYIN